MGKPSRRHRELRGLFPLGWRIWYDDDSTFSSRDGSPDDAPDDGVQAISRYSHYRDNARREPHNYRDVETGEDVYTMTEEGGRREKFGRLMRDAAFERLMQRVLADTWDRGA